jgi:hypothetical protein
VAERQASTVDELKNYLFKNRWARGGMCAPLSTCFGVHAGEGGSKLPTLQGVELATLDCASSLAPSAPGVVARRPMIRMCLNDKMELHAAACVRVASQLGPGQGRCLLWKCGGLRAPGETTHHRH